VKTSFNTKFKRELGLEGEINQDMEGQLEQVDLVEHLEA